MNALRSGMSRCYLQGWLGVQIQPFVAVHVCLLRLGRVSRIVVEGLTRVLEHGDGMPAAVS